MNVYSDRSSETFRAHSKRVFVHVRVLRMVHWDIQNVCMFMYVFSDWSSGTFRTCVCSCTCSQTGTVGHSERVYVHVRVLRLVQWDIQNVCIFMHVFSDWSSGTFRTCVCLCTCSQTGTVGHSERVYFHARVLKLVQWDIQNVCMFMYVFSDWNSGTFRTSISRATITRKSCKTGTSPRNCLLTPAYWTTQPSCTSTSSNASLQGHRQR